MSYSSDSIARIWTILSFTQPYFDPFGGWLVPMALLWWMGRDVAALQAVAPQIAPQAACPV